MKKQKAGDAAMRGIPALNQFSLGAPLLSVNRQAISDIQDGAVPQMIPAFQALHIGIVVVGNMGESVSTLNMVDDLASTGSRDGLGILKMNDQ